MATKKKTLLMTVIAVAAVLVIGSTIVTYAWFLSRYSAEFEYVLESDGYVILQYETDLNFASGSIETPSNDIVPATARQFYSVAYSDDENGEYLRLGASPDKFVPFEDATAAEKSSGTRCDITPTLGVGYVEVPCAANGHNHDWGTFVRLDPAYSAMDMFDGTKMASIASPAHFSGKAAYWTGSLTETGEFTFELSASIKESGDNETPWDLVKWGEIDYLLIMSGVWSGYAGGDGKVLLFDGKWYANYVSIGDNYTTVQPNEADFVLPSVIDNGIDMRYWKLISSAERVKTREVLDGNDQVIDSFDCLLLTPNREFDYDLFVFAARPDELLDPAVNGSAITLTATIRAHEPEPSPEP